MIAYSIQPPRVHKIWFTDLILTNLHLDGTFFAIFAFTFYSLLTNISI